MPPLNTDFFINLDMENSEAEEGAVQTVFQGETYALSKGNSGYTAKLRRHMEALERLEKSRNSRRKGGQKGHK